MIFPITHDNQRVMVDSNLLIVLIFDNLYCLDCLDCLDCLNCLDFPDCLDCSDFPDCVDCPNCLDWLDCHNFPDCPDCIDCLHCPDCLNCPDYPDCLDYLDCPNFWGNFFLLFKVNKGCLQLKILVAKNSQKRVKKGPQIVNFFTLGPANYQLFCDFLTEARSTSKQF